MIRVIRLRDVCHRKSFELYTLLCTAAYMKNILCPTDFTDTAQCAVAYSAKFCQRAGAQLTLFHAITFGELVPNEFIWGRSVTVEATQYHLDELCLEIKRVYKISCEAEVEPSNRSVAQIIKDECDRFDLVIMGTNGPDNFYEYFAGSNTYQVAKDTEKPLLLVPSHFEYLEIREIVCASDYLHSHDAQYNQLLTWASLLQAHVTMLQVLPEQEHAGESESLKLRQFQLRKLFNGKLNLDFKTVRAADTASGIRDFIANHGCDALAVCARHYPVIRNLFHRSITKSLSADVSVPLFIFHN